MTSFVICPVPAAADRVASVIPCFTMDRGVQSPSSSTAGRGPSHSRAGENIRVKPNVGACPDGTSSRSPEEYGDGVAASPRGCGEGLAGVRLSTNTHASLSYRLLVPWPADHLSELNTLLEECRARRAGRGLTSVLAIDGHGRPPDLHVASLDALCAHGEQRCYISLREAYPTARPDTVGSTQRRRDGVGTGPDSPFEQDAGMIKPCPARPHPSRWSVFRAHLRRCYNVHPPASRGPVAWSSILLS